MSAAPSRPTVPSEVLVVGAGIAGLACARALHDAGVAVRVVDRGRRPGGRMSGRTLHGRPVDLGAAYFTVPASSTRADEPGGSTAPGVSAASGVPDASGVPGAPGGAGDLDGTVFGDVVASWVRRGLARPWTDTLTVLDASAVAEADTEADTNADAIADREAHTAPVHRARTKSGPVRYAAGRGLRSLLLDLAEGLEVDLEFEVTGVRDDGTVSGRSTRTADRDADAGTTGRGIDGARFAAIVLALPEPQAARLLAPGSPLAGALDVAAWEPTLAVALGYDARRWPAELHGAFVENSPALTFLADDGDRRGDGAAVLVAHTTPELARAHLAAPEGAIDTVSAAVADLLDLDPGTRPTWTHAHRWTFARAAATHPEPFARHVRLAVCGDAWGGRSSVATAWASGNALGRALAIDLAPAAD